jgi:His-Xaa-Ser repeat protein HxsA
MKPRTFLIPTLIAAGFSAHEPGVAKSAGFANALPTFDPNGRTLLAAFKQDPMFQLAGHRSHSSHSSHRSSSTGGHYSHASHASHQSSTGGSYVSPAPTYRAPVYVPPSTPKPRPTSAPSSTGQRPATLGNFGQTTPSSQYAAPSTTPRTLSGRSAQFKTIVQKVQIALLARDLYAGPIDGIVGPGLRGAIRKFQESQNLPVTGTITSDVLDGLRIGTSP